MPAEVERNLPAVFAWAKRLSLILLLAWIGYAALGTNVFGSRPFPGSMVDYRIQYEESRSIVRDGHYHDNRIFVYPPSAVALFYLTAWSNYPVAAGMQLLLVIGATVGTFALGTSLVGLRGDPLRWPVALGALVLLNYSVVWDLRSLNCNMLFCFLLTASLLMLQPRSLGRIFSGRQHRPETFPYFTGSVLALDRETSCVCGRRSVFDLIFRSDTAADFWTGHFRRSHVLGSHDCASSGFRFIAASDPDLDPNHASVSNGN